MGKGRGERGKRETDKRGNERRSGGISRFIIKANYV